MTYRWITLDNGRSVYRKDPIERGPASDLSAPMLISDHMAPTWHPKDGREYESKSQFRSITARDGSIEVGNDAQTVTRETEPLHKDVGEAIRKVKAGYRPTVNDTGSEGWN